MFRSFRCCSAVVPLLNFGDNALVNRKQVIAAVLSGKLVENNIFSNVKRWGYADVTMRGFLSDRGLFK